MHGSMMTCNVHDEETMETKCRAASVGGAGVCVCGGGSLLQSALSFMLGNKREGEKNHIQGPCLISMAT